MSGVLILGLAALSAWLAINIAIAVAAVIFGRHLDPRINWKWWLTKRNPGQDTRSGSRELTHQ